MLDMELDRKLRALLQAAAEKIDRASFEQEPHFTSAFFGKLHEEEVRNSAGQYIRFKFSASNDRGRGSAEKQTGIDVGMVFEWTDQDGTIFQKAVLLQAKNHLLNLSAAENEELSNQCVKMGALTSSYVVMDCPYDQSIPKVCLAMTTTPYWVPPPVPLDEFLIHHVLACKQGDVAGNVVQIARQANRTVFVETNAPVPTSKPKPKQRPKK